MTRAAAGVLEAELAQLVGGPAESGTTGLDPVNAPMIRHWCEALGDDNPIYVDDDAARLAGHGGLVAPPTMLQVWTMKGLAALAGPPTSASRVLALLDSAGYTSVVATDCVQTYERYLHPGDLLTDRISVESVSGLKQTALGAGYFVTTRRDYLDQSGARVASMQFRLLKFRTSERAEPAPRRPAPVTTRDTAFFFDALQDGRLVVQRCLDCASVRHPPSPVCPECGSQLHEQVEISGRGSVYSYVVVHHPRSPAFDYPLVIGLIELDEGVRMIADIEGVDPEQVTVGMPVELGPAPGVELPRFRRRLET